MLWQKIKLAIQWLGKKIIAGFRWLSANSPTPLWIAAQNGETETVRWLLSHANPERNKIIQQINKASNNPGTTALYQAASNGHTDCVRLLLLEASTTYEARPDGCTPLFGAAQNGKTETVRWLFSNANPRRDKVIQLINNAWNKTGATALHQAAQNGHTDCIGLLFQAGATYETRPDGCTPLFGAAENGKTETVRWLLSNANPERDKVIQQINNVWNKTGATALHQAAKNGHTDCVRLLLLEASTTYKAHPDGYTPLWIAAQNGKTETVRWLLSDANPQRDKVIQLINNAWNKTGATALHQAAQAGHTDCVRLLLEAGARQKPAKNGITPAQITGNKNHLAIRDMLKNAEFFSWRKKRNYGERLDKIHFNHTDAPKLFRDPILYRVMDTPISLPDGRTYEVTTIIDIMKDLPWFKSPFSRKKIDRDIVLQCEPNFLLMSTIEKYVIQQEENAARKEQNIAQAVEPCQKNILSEAKPGFWNTQADKEQRRKCMQEAVEKRLKNSHNEESRKKLIG